MSTTNLALLIPFAAIAFSMAIALVAIMAEHQRKMTELLQNNSTRSDDALTQMTTEMQALQARVAELQDQVNRQAIERDDLMGRMSQENQNQS